MHCAACFPAEEAKIMKHYHKAEAERKKLMDEVGLVMEQQRKDYFFIIDGHSLIYRACFSPSAELTSPDGEPTRGTYIFLKTLIKLVREQKPAYLAVAVDCPRKNYHRRALFDGYKAGRPSMNNGVRIQLKRCKQLLRALGIPIFRADTFEADDVIATLVHECASEEVHCRIVTKDKDLHQLVSDQVAIFDADTRDLVGPSEVARRWGVPPEQVVAIQTLAGDPTDGVPGVPGIGLETAKDLVKRYGSLVAILRSLDELPQRVADAIARTDIRLARKLVQLRTDVPLDIDHEELAFNGLDFEAAQPIFKTLGFRRFILEEAAAD